MSVFLAKTAGFCMGVKRAVDTVLDIARHKGSEKIYTYGPLIHNPQTVEFLRERGIIPIKDIEALSASDQNAAIVIRAHGISPSERKKIRNKGLRIIDATCPKVTHVQAIIRQHAAKDYNILIIGDGDHPEVNGLLGHAGGHGRVIGSLQNVEELPIMEKVCVVAQTTQNVEEYAAIVRRIRDRFPETVVFNTICDSTEQRQAEVRELAARMEAMVIVGGRNSANTRRLAALSSQQGTPTFHIETADELNDAKLAPYDRIGLSAGASTPNWIIDRVVDRIAEQQRKKKNKGKGLLKLWTLSVRTDLYSALGAACLSLTAMLLERVPVNILFLLITALYVHAMHTFNRFSNRKTCSIGSFREESYLKHENFYLSGALASMLLCLGLALSHGMRTFLLLFFISGLGILYNLPIFPAKWRYRSLKDLPGSKNISMAMAWATVVAILPGMERGLFVSPGIAIAFLFTMGIVFIRSSLSDILDIQRDRLIGKETIPVLIGREPTQVLLTILSIFIFFLLIAGASAKWTPSLSLVLPANLFYVWICFKLCDRRASFSGVVLEGLLETSYIIAGLSSLLWCALSR
ncbi:4-hydroxy-3-methylbut-2-enyl diphosphate reductase [Syntrophus aciditrophicus]|uniref:4-hydroxy-3-methylbut-2-enyl diphosphate reductase n=1 Tax=Syntrophus aciditrophicus (strain SB) TaxID=56780 RepID=Q2LUA5_SYNAS|nr:4-hydroxy-3-methylbut-2-enyl diphosphate reductase [Syntrophus aciditrophicus]ABC77667.1 4-hydroxy-3-methylbut-2-enyl diphosphate reductase [Syntrophus aciditrophicus SB]OPY14569.1 MAG: 4-hydroxy-3-methylbut-2-enyl diphosphate reductase [Syntrophus sp. PtaB.Bin075]